MSPVRGPRLGRAGPRAKPPTRPPIIRRRSARRGLGKVSAKRSPPGVPPLDLRNTVENRSAPGRSICKCRIRAWCPMRNCRSGTDLPDLAGRCSWPPALRFIRPLDQRDGGLRTVDEHRTREDEQHQGGDDDGKEQAIHQSQARAACLVPRRAWVASASS
jgi:hypothetical protein